MFDTSKPFFPVLADRGKADPYHVELSDTDVMELAELAKALRESYGE